LKQSFLIRQVLKNNQKIYLPLVSIITPCYNTELYIEETIKSVLVQTYKNWEMIIIEDGSTDKSRGIIQSYVRQDSRIRLINNSENIGVAQSRNKGIEVASGEYIAFLDSDDVWLENKLMLQLNIMQKENVYLCYSAYDIIDSKGNILSNFKIRKQVSYKDMLKTSSMGTLTTIYNAKVLGKYYFENIGHEDYAMKLQILKTIPYAKGVNQTLARYRVHSQSLSVNKFQAALWQWHIYRKIEKLSFFQSAYYFIHYAYYGILKSR